jgi:hypothetical protein
MNLGEKFNGLTCYKLINITHPNYIQTKHELHICQSSEIAVTDGLSKFGTRNQQPATFHKMASLETS